MSCLTGLNTMAIKFLKNKKMRKQLLKVLVALVSWITFFHFANAETIGIFLDTKISQHEFAASDIKKALETKGFAVEFFDIKKLSPDYPNRKVVITLKTDTKSLGQLKIGGGANVNELGEQAFAILTANGKRASWFVVGGDMNGAMYGGLQLAENINLYGLEKNFNEDQSPDILNRGIKFNIPFDKRSPTYYGSGFSKVDFKGTSTQKAIEHVWQIKFWADMFDELARHRYNVLSLWSLHPFAAMIQLPEYPDAAIQNIEGFDGFSKKMSMDEKIEFWKQIMILAKNRGFEFYIYNWNIYTYGATGKYGIDNNARNPNTVEYMRKSMTRLFETYPDLTGFGVTAGENMGDINDEEEARWTWATYGQGIFDFAKAHPERNVVFVHRYHGAGGPEVAANFKTLRDLPNVQFDFSFKYAVAHIYSTTTPNWIRTRNGDVPAQLVELNLKTWVELRNDDFYYLHWGDPGFVKRYLAALPDKDRCIRGFVTGSDGYTPTYVFTSKADWAKGKLDMQRTWYTWMLWGRLAYNPQLTDEFFQDILRTRYPDSHSKSLFEAWSQASQGIPLFTELIQGTLISDWLWYPEACMSRRDGFVTIEKMAEAVPPPGSNLCSIDKSAAKNCGDKKSSYQVADEIESHAKKALKILVNEHADLNTELGTNIGNIRAMSYLGLYFAEKIRGATFKVAAQNEQAKDAMGKACGYWSKYISLMDEMYTGQDLQRTNPITNWHMLDADVLNEYIKLGGKVSSPDAH